METLAPPFEPRPLTSNVVDADVLRSQRRSDRKLAQLLGITIAREDGLPSTTDGDDTVPLNRFGEGDGEDANHSEQWRAPAAWYTSDEGMEVEEQPLIDKRVDDKRDVRSKSKSKTRQKLAGLFPFRGRNRDQYKTPRLLGGRATRPSLIPKTSPPSVRNPFGDEHAIAPDPRTDPDCGQGTQTQDEQMDTHQDGSPSPTPTTASDGQWAAFPSLAAAHTHTVSAPTTPKRSPRRRTPGSAKSWLSEVSNASALSTSGSLRRKSVRRRARLSNGHESKTQIRSMRKTVQVLGPEAAGAVAKGTGVSPNKLRYMDFGRQMREYMKRQM